MSIGKKVTCGLLAQSNYQVLLLVLILAVELPSTVCQAQHFPAETPWYRNTLHGISFETPLKVVEAPTKPPAEVANVIKTVKYYRYRETNFLVAFTFMESIFTKYNKKLGLKSAMENLVTTMRGSDLKLDFSEVKGDSDDLRCDGTFRQGEITILIKGYILWDSGDISIITAMGSSRYIDDLDRVLSGLRILP